MGLLRVAGVMAAAALAAGCALMASMRDETIAGFCGVSRGESWARIEAPADADAFRQRALADPMLSGRRPRGDEYWFALADGAVRYCLTPLERADFVPSRNRSGCHERIGTWWDFTRTDAGPVTAGAEEHICLT